MSFSKDPDMQRFISDLQDTGPGIRWRRAWAEMQRCVRAIKDVDKISTPQTRHAHILVLQRRYMAASELASDYLDELSLVHAWPPDATAQLLFTWAPSPDFRARKSL